MSEQKVNELVLHKAVFNGDSKSIEQLLKTLNENEVNYQDIHGNTALHIAVMKGNIECVELLVKSGADLLIRNKNNWTPIDEAISSKNLKIIKLLNEKFSEKRIKVLERDSILKLMNDIQVDFESVLFITYFVNYAKHKTKEKSKAVHSCGNSITLTKKGLKLRIDFKLKIHGTKPTHVYSVLFDLTQNNDTFMTFIIGEEKGFYQNINSEEWKQLLVNAISQERREEEISNQLKSPIISSKFLKDPNYKKPSVFNLKSAQKVGEYKALIYECIGMNLQIKKRSEHLEVNQSDDKKIEMDWNQYIDPQNSMSPNLGRKLIQSIETNTEPISVGVSNQISFDVKNIVQILSQFSNNQTIEENLQFINELPKGFPVFLKTKLKDSLIEWKLKSIQSKSDSIKDSIFILSKDFKSKTIFDINQNSK